MTQLAIETMTTEAQRRARLASLRMRRNQLETEARPLKARLRSTWHEPMADAQRRMLQLQASLTEIYTLLAFSRGRVHRRHEPRSWQGTAQTGPFEPLAHARRIARRLAPELLSGERS